MSWKCYKEVLCSKSLVNLFYEYFWQYTNLVTHFTRISRLPTFLELVVREKKAWRYNSKLYTIHSSCKIRLAGKDSKITVMQQRHAFKSEMSNMCQCCCCPHELGKDCWPMHLSLQLPPGSNPQETLGNLGAFVEYICIPCSPWAGRMTTFCWKDILNVAKRVTVMSCA